MIAQAQMYSAANIMRALVTESVRIKHAIMISMFSASNLSSPTTATCRPIVTAPSSVQICAVPAATDMRVGSMPSPMK